MIKKKTTSKKAPPKTKTKTTPRKKPASKPTKKDEPSVTILQTTKCQSLSNKSTLTYNIGVDDKNQILVRVLSNSGGGYFSKEWIAYGDIKAMIDGATDEKPIASFKLLPLFKAKSVNTPSFLLALLLKETLFKSLP